MSFQTNALLFVFAMALLIESIFSLREAMQLRKAFQQDKYVGGVAPVRRRWAHMLVFWHHFILLLSGTVAIHFAHELSRMW
jgi:hypothetical protein